MKQIELLAPAKDKETAITAINSGCDALYIGADSFGARQNASNSLEDIKEIVQYAHKFNVKVHITINTILDNKDFNEILNKTHNAYEELHKAQKQLKQLQESDELIQFISGTFNTEGTLMVLPINSHIYEDKTIDNIKNYHSQKTKIQANLNTLTENINTVNNTLISTDWSQETEQTQEGLQSQIQQYYSERLTLERQLNAVISEINTLTNENNVTTDTKYRVRGVTNITELEKFIKTIGGSKVNIIGLDVEYKYKSISRNNTNVSDIADNIFSDWNRLNNIDRQRKLVFNEASNAFEIEFVNYDSITNIIKWNQIDIPINSSEDVIIRIRYKYNIGQPFINVYSPWSEELTVSFPTEYADNVEIAKIVAVNNDDVVSAKFTGKLINDGYEEHIVNKVVANNQTFYHMPENIYSGFNTSENNLISLKDKLVAMCNDIDVYKELIKTESQKKFSVFLQYDSKSIELHTGSTNKINIYNIEHIKDCFIRKDMNIVIKNTGEVPINLYSIFPGNIDVPLVLCNYEYYRDNIPNYYRVPLFVDNILYPQTLGQWIYFRENNIYTGKSVLYNTDIQKQSDYINKIKILNINSAKEIYSQDNIQLGIANKYMKSIIDYNNSNYLGFISKDGVKKYDINTLPEYSDIEYFLYREANSSSFNTVIYKYEDICGTLKTNISQKIYLSSETSISEFINNVNVNNTEINEIKDYDGAFLFVNLLNSTQLSTDGSDKGNKEIGVGESISIPLTFEYFLNDKNSISKTIMFDIKHSLLTEPLNYILEITANYDTSLETNMYSNNVMINDYATEQQID